MVLVDLGAKVNILIAAGEYGGCSPPPCCTAASCTCSSTSMRSLPWGRCWKAMSARCASWPSTCWRGLYGSLAQLRLCRFHLRGGVRRDLWHRGRHHVYFFRYRDNFGAQGAPFAKHVGVVVINLVFGLSAGNIDNWGHMGGLFGGALAAFGLLPRYRQPVSCAPRHHAAGRGGPALCRSWLGALLLWLFVAGVYVVTQNYNPISNSCVDTLPTKGTQEETTK
jgi:hypothetical protein